MKEFNLEKLNILIIEDNKHMQLLLREILRAFRITAVKSADDGADALKELKTFPADLIICDWVMEPIDGIEFVKMVRTMSDIANPYVGIIMLTGHTEASRVFEARDAGVNEFLAKPISAKSLYSRICSVVERPRPFVRTRQYFGPDRRRRKGLPDGPKRRKDDEKG